MSSEDAEDEPQRLRSQAESEAAHGDEDPEEAAIATVEFQVLRGRVPDPAAPPAASR